MIENIRNEFKVMLSSNKWMDEESKTKAREKADFIDVKVGYPDYTYNDAHINDLYKNVIKSTFFFEYLFAPSNHFFLHVFRFQVQIQRQEVSGKSYSSQQRRL